jgi:hypothetical protein
VGRTGARPTWDAAPWAPASSSSGRLPWPSGPARSLRAPQVPTGFRPSSKAIGWVWAGRTSSRRLTTGARWLAQFAARSKKGCLCRPLSTRRLVFRWSTSSAWLPPTRAAGTVPPTQHGSTRVVSARGERDLRRSLQCARCRTRCSRTGRRPCQRAQHDRQKERGSDGGGHLSRDWSTLAQAEGGT